MNITLFSGLLVLSLVVGYGTALNRPNLSETFELQGLVTLRQNNSLVYGQAKWAVDYKSGKALDELEFYDSSYQHLDVHALLRYDLGKQFLLSAPSKCREQVLAAPGPQPVWDWLRKAVPEGHATPGTDLFQLWSYRAGNGVKLSVGVSLDDADRLLFFRRSTPKEQLTFFVEPTTSATHYQAAPRSALFDVPIACADML